MHNNSIQFIHAGSNSGKVKSRSSLSLRVTFRSPRQAWHLTCSLLCGTKIRDFFLFTMSTTVLQSILLCNSFNIFLVHNSTGNSNSILQIEMQNYQRAWQSGILLKTIVTAAGFMRLFPEGYGTFVIYYLLMTMLRVQMLFITVARTFCNNLSQL